MALRQEDRRTNPPMKIWNKRINEAHTWHDLLQVARDYIAALEPQEWASVPPVARPDRIKGIDDITFWHDRLENEYLRIAARPDVPDAFRHMLGFFRALAERASEMYGTATPPGQEADNDGDATRPPRDARARD